MSRWLKLAVLAIAVTLFAPSGTTTVSAATRPPRCALARSRSRLPRPVRLSHVAGQRDSQWISTKRDPVVAAEKYGSNGTVAIDLDQVPGQVVDLTGGIPGHQPCMMCNWAIKAQEVLIQGGVPPSAIVRRI